MDEMTGSYTEICDEGKRIEEVETVVAEEPPSITENIRTSDRPTELNLDALHRLDGTVIKHGDMISFVAGDLENKIRLCSPTSSRSAAVNGVLIEELEREAASLATAVDSLAESLAETLHSASALTVDCLEVYRDAVCKACDSVDANIKAMYQLVAKCEEISKSMNNVHQLAAHIKNIKHLLDMYEALPS